MKNLKSFKKFEIVDYDEKIPDGEKHEGNFYFYSKEPIKLEDLSDTISCYFNNRADASDSISNYIYQIKTKYPIYKDTSMDISSDFGDLFGDKKGKKAEKDNSGYFKKNWITQEMLAYIKKSDVISFRLIGGFNKYDRSKVDKLNVELSEETDDYLYTYISGKIQLNDLTPEIEKELSKFNPTKSIKIYKGIEEVQIKYQSDNKPPYKKGEKYEAYIPHPSSWTTNILIARRFIDDYPSSTPYVVSMLVNPVDILVDVRKLPKEYYHMDQREIIVKPGNYEYKIIWAN